MDILSFFMIYDSIFLKELYSINLGNIFNTSLNPKGEQKGPGGPRIASLIENQYLVHDFEKIIRNHYQVDCYSFVPNKRAE